MKWGVRKNPRLARDRAEKKLKKLDQKVVKAESKIGKRQAKATKAQARAQRAILFKGIKNWSAAGRTTKLAKAYMNVQRKKIAAKTWVDSMDNVFKNTKVKSMDKEAASIGKKYASMTMDEILSNSQNIDAILRTSDRYRTRYNL